MHAGADAVPGVRADALSYDHGHLRVACRRTPATAGVGPSARRLVEHRAQILATGAATAILTGGLLHLAGQGAIGDDVWAATVALLAADLLVEVAHTVVVEHHLGVDAIALVAMVGALALGQQLAGIVVGLMFTGGAALEDWSSRARGT